MGTTKRQAGEAGCSEYPTKAGPSFVIEYPVLPADGSKRVVLERGFTTRRGAAAADRAVSHRVDRVRTLKPAFTTTPFVWTTTTARRT
jgi:hypothetical protein